jgi:hypothetical protein
LTLPRRTDIDYDAIAKPANLPDLVSALRDLFNGVADEERPSEDDMVAALEAAFYNVDRAGEYLLATAQPRRDQAPPPAQLSPEDLALTRGIIAELTAATGRPLTNEESVLLIQVVGLTAAPDPAARRAQVIELYTQLAATIERPAE